MTNLIKILKETASFILNLGSEESLSIREKGSISFVYTLSVFSAITLLLSSIFELSHKMFHFYFDITFAILFALIPLLIYFKKFDLAKLALIYIEVIAIYTGTFIFDFGDFFKFTIIIPITLYFLFYKTVHTWSFYTLLFLTYAYIVTNFVVLQGVNAEASYNQNFDYIVYALTVTILIYTKIVFNNRINKSEQQLKTQLDYEKAISDFSHMILSNEEDKLDKALEIVLKATNTSRLYMFEIKGNVVYRTHETYNKGVPRLINSPDAMNNQLVNEKFINWVSKYVEKNYITGKLSDAQGIERVLLEQQQIKSLLAIPVFSKDEWNGFICFDDVFEETEWEKSHIHLLKAIADMIGLYRDNKIFQNNMIEQNKELVKLNATKDKFFSIVAHDLRSPYNALIGLSDLLLEEVENVENENIREYSKFINKGMISSFEYLSNLLEWSRLQTKNTEFIPKPFAFNDLIEEVVEFISIQAGSKDINIETSIEEHLEVEADFNMIKTVIVNLVSNAIKYSHKGGNVVIKSKKTDNKLEVCVQDNGVGIKEEVRKKLFCIDGPQSTPGTNNEAGTGLGLILCKEFITLHNGDIHIESEINRGSNFIITIPIYQN